MAEFTTPEFLQDVSEEEIFEQMTAIIPDDIDLSQGSHTWNFTRPTALIAAYLYQYVLPQVIQLIFPDWSYGEFLDNHAAVRGMARKAATAASGSLTITGEANTVIPAGSLFSTASVNGEASVDYATTADVTIPTSGTTTVTVECTQTGTIGNTGPDTVIFVSSQITTITSVTNPDAITGGTAEEDDASLIARIDEYDITQGDSFIGNVSDYQRWATSVSGIGDATIIPAEDDTGLVKIILTDSNGDPASDELCTDVYNYIMRPDDPSMRLAPINAYLQVEAPEALAIGVKAVVELTEGATLESVQSGFYEQLVAYLPIAMQEEEIKVTKVEAALSNTAGVNDFSGVEIGVKNGSTIVYDDKNITIATTQLPTVAAEDLILQTGTVDGHETGTTALSTSDDGEGNITVQGATATTDGNGNVTINGSGD